MGACGTTMAQSTLRNCGNRKDRMIQLRPILDKGGLAPEYHAIYDSISSSRGGVSELFGLLLHDPKLADCIAQLGHQIRFDSPLSADVKEVVILTVAAELPGSYFWNFHAPLARRAGVSDGLMRAIKSKDDVPGDDGRLLDYIRSVIACRTPKPDVGDALLKRFGASGIVALTSTISYYVMLISFMAAFGLSIRVPETGTIDGKP